MWVSQDNYIGGRLGLKIEDLVLERKRWHESRNSRVNAYGFSRWTELSYGEVVSGVMVYCLYRGFVVQRSRRLFSAEHVQETTQ